MIEEEREGSGKRRDIREGGEGESSGREMWEEGRREKILN